MYSIDLNKFTLDEFAEILRSIELLPGRRILLNNLDRTILKIKNQNIETLFELQKILNKKSDYPALSKKLSVDKEYLIVLNREINSYESKPLPLDKLETFSEKEINILMNSGIKTTKGLYEKSLKRSDRKTLSKEIAIDEKKLLQALEIIDLLRVNGVGPVYARILNEMGIKSISGYLNMNSDDILRKYQEINPQRSYSKAKLGLKDVEYCKRFCKKLDKDIEW